MNYPSLCAAQNTTAQVVYLACRATDAAVAVVPFAHVIIFASQPFSCHRECSVAGLHVEFWKQGRLPVF